MKKFTVLALTLVLVGGGVMPGAAALAAAGQASTASAERPSAERSSAQSSSVQEQWVGKLRDVNGQPGPVRLNLVISGANVTGTAHVPAQLLVAETDLKVTGELSGGAAQLWLRRANGALGYLAECRPVSGDLSGSSAGGQWRCVLQSSASATNPAAGTAMGTGRVVSVLLSRN
ncbi:hypothetical protein [Deinococcus sp.]|uniref:hypothetical protein n=1 Tax=Deinococcus sp. TaxID=47478 RepID=UPI0025BB7164|nr:hypothetical protein [Deinococcus sp.]